jgi:hypothetical protein
MVPRRLRFAETPVFLAGQPPFEAPALLRTSDSSEGASGVPSVLPGRAPHEGDFPLAVPAFQSVRSVNLSQSRRHGLLGMQATPVHWLDSAPRAPTSGPGNPLADCGRTVACPLASRFLIWHYPSRVPSPVGPDHRGLAAMMPRLLKSAGTSVLVSAGQPPLEAPTSCFQFRLRREGASGGSVVLPWQGSPHGHLSPCGSGLLVGPSRKGNAVTAPRHAGSACYPCSSAEQRAPGPYLRPGDSPVRQRADRSPCPLARR